MTSQLNVDTIVDKAGSGGTNVKIANNSVTVSEGGSATTTTVQGLCKAWANYGADGGTPSTNQSFNISSISDAAVGDFDFNFSNNLSAVGSGFNISARYSNGDELATQTGARVFTTHISVKCGSNTTTQTDHDEGNVGGFGDLA